MLYFCSNLYHIYLCKFWLISYFALVNLPARMVFFRLVVSQGGLMLFSFSDFPRGNNIFPLVTSQGGLIFFPLVLSQGVLTFFPLVISQ